MDPIDVPAMPKTGVVGHDTENVDIRRLGSQIDGEILRQRSVPFDIRPWTVERPQKCSGSHAIAYFGVLANPSRKYPAPPRRSIQPLDLSE